MAKNISKKIIKKNTPWLLNKIQFIRRVTKPLAARSGRWGGPAGVALVIFLLVGYFFYPKDEIQILKIRLLNNPYDFKSHLALVEKLLDNNQFEQAEQALLLAQNLQITNSTNQKVLGETTSSQLQELWQKKHYADPKDIQRLIDAWGKIIQEKPNFRDGYLQLAILHYKIYENEKAKEYLNKALEIDPNYQPTRELEKILK
jgi:tetratricopeptide (TPR) repeat protein